MIKFHTMKCGHLGTEENEKGQTFCPLCYGVTEKALQIREDVQPLAERTAECDYCFQKEQSSPKLPYFRHQPHKLTDGFYCGCLEEDVDE